MSADNQIRLTLEQEEDYAFRIRFEGMDLEPLLTDEPAPLGEGRGPNPSALLLASIANCLGASLLFALRKFKNKPGALRAMVSATPERNANGRWRIPRAAVELHLAEDGEAHEQLERVLQQFQEFCIVTQSVRDGIDVSVTIKDTSGCTLLSGQGHAVS